MANLRRFDKAIRHQQTAQKRARMDRCEALPVYYQQEPRRPLICAKLRAVIGKFDNTAPHPFDMQRAARQREESVEAYRALRNGVAGSPLLDPARTGSSRSTKGPRNASEVARDGIMPMIEEEYLRAGERVSFNPCVKVCDHNVEVHSSPEWASISILAPSGGCEALKHKSRTLPSLRRLANGANRAFEQIIKKEKSS